MQAAYAATRVVSSIRPVSWHTFRDGDIVDLVIRSEDGTTYVERADFHAIVAEYGTAKIEHYLFRYDSTTDSVALDRVIDMRLVTPREDRRPVDLEMQ